MNEETYAGAGGTKIFMRSWRPEKARGVVVIVHGFKSHSGLYQRVAEQLVASVSRSSPSTCAVTGSRKASATSWRSSRSMADITGFYPEAHLRLTTRRSSEAKKIELGVAEADLVVDCDPDAAGGCKLAT